jgi:metal-responsive CopG/Arc/MetJ family transcriptional regulator
VNRKAHLAIPEDLIAEVDRVAGKRRRSLFIVEATREKLAKERFMKVLEETSGAWSDKNHPELTTAKSMEQYIREKRRPYGKRLK